MDQTLIKKWIVALRSKKYQQCREQLKSEKGFCCLGVLCDISGTGHWQNNHFIYEPNGRHDVTFNALPSELLSAIQFTREDEVVLMKMNDQFKYTFDEIASYIEEHYDNS